MTIQMNNREELQALILHQAGIIADAARSCEGPLVPEIVMERAQRIIELAKAIRDTQQAKSREALERRGIHELSKLMAVEPDFVFAKAEKA